MEEVGERERKWNGGVEMDGDSGLEGGKRTKVEGDEEIVRDGVTKKDRMSADVSGWQEARSDVEQTRRAS